MTKTTLAIAVAMAFSPAIYANTLGTIVVTDDGLPMASDSRTAESFRLTAKQEGGEILRNTLGVDASRMGGHGLDPTIRGQSQTQLNVILDDAYLHGGCPNRMDPPTSFANIESYDSVRIIQGVETLQYGTGGTGGTILFERGLPEMGTHGKIEVGAGSNAYKSSANAEVSTRSELGYIRAFAINKDGSNYKDGNGNTVRASYSTEHHGVIAGLTPKAGERIEMSAEKIVTHNALFQGSGMDAPYDEMNIMRLKYRSSNGFGFVDGVKADLSYAADEHLMDNYSLRPNMAMRMKSPTTSNTLSGKLALTSKLSSSTSVEYGLNIQNVNRKAELVRVMPLPQTNMSFNWPNVSTDRIGVFAEALHKLTNESRVKAGVRVDKVTAEADLLNAKANPMAITPAQMYDRVYGYKGDGKANEDHWSALARYELDLAKDLTWFTGVSRTMRTADETERFFANGASVNATGSFNTPGSAWVGNPNLNPEKHVQIDTGLSKQTEHYGWRATVFYDAVQDYILRDQRMVTNGKITTYRNVNATLYGALVEGYTGFAWNTQLAGGLNYVNSHNDSDNRNIAQTPPLSGYVALNKQAGDLGLGARFRFQDKQSAIDTLSGLDTQKTPAWSVLDLYGSYRINKTVKVMAGVDNVFDHAYFQHVGRTDSLTGNTINLYEPGRSAWVKLSAKF
ncbi:MAG: TonB-dependent receptor [Gammaproteobacteria bacterium]|nr:TonB-dependent receptor [Gammaproteobacteria bacterium]MCL5796786.1 TonB-dependent receptor [Gammaproteobacteria bacterium]UCG18211.1 MAG: TonB-dependent receptor [Thiotrichales bacterium]